MDIVTTPTVLQPGWRDSIWSVNGIDLHVVEAGREGDPLLVLLHGFPEFRWAWRHQITQLAQAEYHVVVPDLRGYNTSAAPQEVAAYRLDTLVADVVALADDGRRRARRHFLVRRARPLRGGLGASRLAHRHAQLSPRCASGGAAPPPARLAPPTLIPWAAGDRFLERHVAAAGLALCDDGRLEFVEGASRWLHIERSDRINAGITAFLAEPDRRTPA